MKYELVVQPRAERQLDRIYAELLGFDQHVADRWFATITTAILTLNEFPKRCPPVPEWSLEDLDVRHLIVEAASRRYRVLFLVRNATVYVLAVKRPLEDYELGNLAD